MMFQTEEKNKIFRYLTRGSQINGCSMLGNKIAGFTNSFGTDVEIVFEFKGSVPQYVKDYGCVSTKWGKLLRCGYGIIRIIAKARSECNKA